MRKCKKVIRKYLIIYISSKIWNGKIVYFNFPLFSYAPYFYDYNEGWFDLSIVVGRFGSRYIKEEFNMAFVPSVAQGALFSFVVVLVCTTSGSGSIFPTPMVLPPPTVSPKSCPLYSTKAGFNLEKVVNNYLSNIQ